MPTLRSTFFSLTCVLLCARALYASAGTEGASFLDIPTGAGPASLGSAYSALAEDAYAATWNPAGLGFLKSSEFAGQHLSYLESTRYDYVAFAVPFGAEQKQGLGFSVQDVASGNIPRTDVVNGAPVTNLGDFSTHWAAYNLSYGQQVSHALSLGVTTKLIRERLDDVSAGAYAFDAGGLYHWNDRLSLAATVLNIGGRLTLLDQADNLPLAFHVGAAYKPNPSWQLSAETTYRRSGQADFETGVQWRPFESLSLRAGYKTDTGNGLSALSGFTTGLGLQLLGQELAYAWVPYGELGDAQYVSLIIRFGARTTEDERILRPQAMQKSPYTDQSLLPEILDIAKTETQP